MHIIRTTDLGRRMIVVRITGGLGNQMFQYACGRALAARKDVRLCFDLSAYRSYRLHGYGLSGFRGEVLEGPWYLTTVSRFSAAARRLGLSPARYFRLLDMCWVDEGGDLRYLPQRLDFSGSAYLDGYWQCARYFEDCEMRIRDDFRLVPPLAELLRERCEAFCIGQRPTVSLHVRRGDYVTDQSANAVHGTLGDDYYRTAVDYLVTRLGHDFRLLVFSDDSAWAKENIRIFADTVYVDADALFPQVDMHLMASCDHHIIANSSFSWWGAWLNPSCAKMVVAPARWFRSDDHCADDICPPSWVRL